MRIVLEGLRGEESIAELCRREGLTPMFTTAGQRSSWRPARSVWLATTVREASSDEVKELRAETAALKETLGEVVMENRLLKKSVLGDGENNI